MNPENKNISGDETSSDPGESSSKNSNSGPTSSVTSQNVEQRENEEMKRAAAKKLIERYFYQLLEGCGNPKCTNKNCASSGEVKNLTPDQAAAKAIQLYSQDAKLCDKHPTKVARLNDKNNDPVIKSNENIKTDSTESKSNTNINHNLDKSVPHSSKSSQSCDENKEIRSTISTKASVSSSTTPVSIDESEILRLIEICHIDNSYSHLIRTLGLAFSSSEAIASSFQKKPCASIDAMLEKAPGDLKSLKKEDLRILEGDLDKDEDSCAEAIPIEESDDIDVDLISLRRAMQKLYDDNNTIFESLNTSIQNLGIALRVDLQVLSDKKEIEKIVTVLIIIFEIFNIAKMQFLEVALPSICMAATYLPIWAQARIVRIWARHSKQNLESLLIMLQQLITLQVISSELFRDSYVQDNEIIVNATKVMKIIYYASILSGVIEPKIKEEEINLPEPSHDDEELFQFRNPEINKSAFPEDPLSIELGVSPLECRKPYIPFESFYNEPLSDIIEMDKDYLNYKQMTSSGKPFSFMLYSFILTPATKTLSLYFDNRIRMYSERRISIFHTHLSGQPNNSYLKLRVRREKIIEDALVELEVVAMCNPKDLKKQLYVEFIGEQGVDEGGVSKEFFQLIIEQIFSPDYGMFIHNEETNNVWFNSTSFENDGQFTLIGIVLGLAIYNNIILAVNFPMVIYRKLMGLRGTFADLEDLNPVLYNSLKSILEYQGNDMEDTFMQTFRLTYADVFGNVLSHDLKPDGDNIIVNQENKAEFVELYSDFLLNQSIEKQFLAFRKGFRMVTDESPLQLLFRPEEIDLLVCGSKQFNFDELEQAAEYEGGYTAESQIILDFWKIVHALPIESKKKLLEFTTGSDRVPVGGLSKLKLVIARHGPDCDRLPTSHTCFNVLLLPEYSSKEKLEERLLKAINYSKGFGMI